MTNADIREAHKLLDYVSQGRAVLDDEIKLLRSFLPELPKQKTLEEIAVHVYGALLGTSGNDWTGDKYDADVTLEAWLSDLHAQLKGLMDTPATVPALPAGMRIAVHAVYGRVVVSPVVDDDGTCKIFHLSTDTRDGSDYCWTPIDSLTFIDYEPAKPAHPEFLETEADYQNAPVGTVVIREGGYPWTRIFDSWVAYSRNDYSHSEMAALRGKSRVLRWAVGNEQL